MKSLNQKMNVIVVGYGSIGKRHVTNLLKLEDIDKVIVCTKHFDSFQEYPEKEKIELIRSLAELPPIIRHGRKFDFAIIANETYKHIETANILANFGIHLFIEKPISHSVQEAIALKEVVEKENINIFIAYNFRFLGALQYIKNKINSGSIGKLYFAEIEVGQYLPQWRPLSDYRDSYSARKDKGGGVALDLSHEIDYMRYLFSDPVSWKIMKSKVSDLEIDSEDIFKGLYRYPSGFLCSVHMDYLRNEKQRKITIIGSKGSLECDFIKKYLKMSTNNGEILLIEEPHLFDVDESYKLELNHFIECIEKDRLPHITMNDGIEVLKLIGDGHV